MSYDDTQRKIIRQNCVGNAVKYYEHKQDVDIKDILKVAEQLEVWINRIEVKL